MELFPFFFLSFVATASENVRYHCPGKKLKKLPAGAVG